MNNLSEHLLELVILASVFFAGWLLGAPLRRRAISAAHPLAVLVGPLATPLIILVFSALLWWVPGWLLGIKGSDWTRDNATLLNIWSEFWGITLALYFLEGAGLMIYRLRGRVFPLPGLMRNLLGGVLLGAAALALVHYKMGVNVSPLLASTALLTAIIGFALQGVLGNLLAGMSIHLTRSTHPGDWVTMGDMEGEVLQTNWRETHLRTVGGHILIVPNSKLADGVVHNMSWPTPIRQHSLFVDANYESAPAEVIAALLAAAQSIPAVLHDPSPKAFVCAYKDFGIGYELRIWTNQHQNRTPISGEINRMIWYQFKRRGIDIPFPMSDKLLCDFLEVVHTHQQRPPPAEDMVQRVRALQHSEFITRLFVDAAGQALPGEAELKSLAPLLHVVRYTTGETVFRQGETGETCYVVIRGRLHGRMEFKEAQQTNEFDLATGALCGEMSLVTGLPRTATITALNEVELLEISQAAFALLLALRPEIPERLAQFVAERAAQNTQTYERLKAVQAGDFATALKRESLLQRFKRLLGQSK